MSAKTPKPDTTATMPPKKDDTQTGGIPLFLEVDDSTSEEKIVGYILQVMHDSGLVFPKIDKLVQKIARKLRENGGSTLSAQVVMAMLVTEAGKTARPTTPEGLPMPEFNANARVVLEKRYLKKDHKGAPTEQPWQMLERVAGTIAAAESIFEPNADVEKLTRRFYETMARLEFLPNSPTLMNAGRDLGQLSACFVLPVGDSMESIFETIKQTALIHKSGGGTGFSFSRLRPTNDIVKSTKGVSSGPISFMTVFDAATDTIKQGGTRRGANMGILRVDHPDILEFITCKSDLRRLNNFNISVAATDKFMEAIKTKGSYELINPRTGKVQELLPARKVFDLIIKQAWSNGEPGLVFLDKINASNPTPDLGEIEATNPCGEQPLLPHESCNLGSINLSRMTVDGKIDWDKLKETVHLAVHFLDNVIEINRYPLPEIAAQTLANRKIGLGVMGYAEMLIQLGIPYDSQKGLDTAKKVMAFINKEGMAASCELAAKRGPFPNIDKSIYKDLPDGKKPRNATVTTIAPTGTLSILAGTSSGIEPIFALSFVRNVLDGTELVEANPLFEQTAKQEGFYSQDLMKQVAETGSVRHMNMVPVNLRKVFATAHDITPTWHVKMQAAFQENTQNAVSKTVNFPEEATEEQVAEAFMLAYEQGCKGITIFRYGSRDPVLSLAKEPKKPVSNKLIEQHAVYNQISPRERPRKLTGATELMTIGCGKLYITTNYDSIGMCEVFTSTGRTGGCPSQSEAISRLVSLALRSGVKVDEIVHQLQGIRCHSAIRRNELIKGGERAVSCPAAIGKAMKIAAERLDQTEPKKKQPVQPKTIQKTEGIQNEAYWLQQGLCPDCHELIEHEGGCVVCRSCGFSKCG